MELAILVEIIKETETNWRFIFESPLYDNINFKPGQLVQLTANPHSEDRFSRNYSVSSWPNGSNKFELIMTYLKGGMMSEHLFKNSKIGDEFGYKGPMGVFTLPDEIDRDIFFVSTGSGISPFRSMLGYINEFDIRHKNIKLFFGTRTHNDIPYYEELKNYQKTIKNFEYIPVLSRENLDGYKSGYVHEHYLKLIDEMDSKPLVYFCGWDKMIREGRDHLSKRGFELMKDIRVEIFG